MRYSPFFLLALFASGLAISDELSDPTKPVPATKLEAFSARTGVVLIKGYSTIGNINSLGRVSVDTREFRDASNPKAREYGITIGVKESGRLERENISYIDAEEIESLIRGIDYISKIDKGATTMTEFEAQYRTKGDFSITTFSSRNGEIGVAVSSGRISKTTAYIKPHDLIQLKAFIAEAKNTIDSIKATTK